MAQDNGAAVPRFGVWNDRDATAPDNYTAIFNQVRQERQEVRQEVARAPTFSSPPSNNNVRNQDPDLREKRCCCFQWRRK